MPVAGWYPDPVHDYEQRWWDGNEWTEHVSTGRFTTTSALTTSLPDDETVVWEHGQNRFTTHFFHLGKQKVTLPWWSVARVYVQVSAAQSLAHTGDLILCVAYPGYHGPAEYRIRGVIELDRIHALAYRLASRRRHEAGHA